MCQSKADGGRRCHGRGSMRAARLDEARQRYGDCVSDHHLSLPRDVQHMVDFLAEHNLTANLVGGSVRDDLLGAASKDLDFEVYGGTLPDIQSVLAERYRVDAVGASFGVLKVRVGGDDVDIAVPRRDSKVGEGHRGFTVTHDPDLTIEEASARRDFTFNAISYDPVRRVLVDPHNGQRDLDDRVIRHVSDAFSEDPLRVYRGVQFAGRFDMTVAPETAQLCQQLADQHNTLAVERIRAEWGKIYAKATRPSRSIEALRATGWDRFVPGYRTADLDQVQQHLDRAVQATSDAGLSGADRDAVMAATAARTLNDSDARTFMHYTVDGGAEQRAAYALSRVPAPALDDASVRAAAYEHRPLTLRQVSAVLAATGNPAGEQLLDRARTLGVLDEPERDLLNGNDLLAAFPDRAPGPWLATMLNQARAAQQQRQFGTRRAAEQWLATQPR